MFSRKKSEIGRNHLYVLRSRISDVTSALCYGYEKLNEKPAYLSPSVFVPL